MKIKVSEATPLQLDYMVGYALGLVAKLHGAIPFSTDWAQGGPIIEREECVATIERLNSGDFRVQMPYDRQAEMPGRYFYGPTPLIAAMRCYVASKLGDEVEVPEELK